MKQLTAAVVFLLLTLSAVLGQEENTRSNPEPKEETGRTNLMRSQLSSLITEITIKHENLWKVLHPLNSKCNFLNEEKERVDDLSLWLWVYESFGIDMDKESDKAAIETHLTLRPLGRRTKNVKKRDDAGQTKQAQKLSQRNELLSKCDFAPEEYQQWVNSMDGLAVNQTLLRTLDKLNEDSEGGLTVGEWIRVFRSERFPSAPSLQDAVILDTHLGESNLWIVLTTPDKQVIKTYPIRPSYLVDKMNSFRRVLEDPSLDPRPLARELYEIIIGPVSDELEEGRVKTILWGSDAVLSFVPIAALHDGEKYVVERYVTAGLMQTRWNLSEESPRKSGWRALAVGVSMAKPGFMALPAVDKEVRGIVAEKGHKSQAYGVLPGKILLNEQFTEHDFLTALREGYQVIHIATHYVHTPDGAGEGYFLLGDGQLMGLSQLGLTEGKSEPLKGVELLTLSACRTLGISLDDILRTGVDPNSGLAQILFQKGAKTVVASAWPVADVSTGILMRRFYQRLASQQWRQRAAALRQTQLELLSGRVKPTNSHKRKQADVRAKLAGRLHDPSGKPFHAPPHAPYAHPYYWAPFLLMGSWQ